MSLPADETDEMIYQFCREYSHMRSLQDYPALNEAAKATFGDETYMMYSTKGEMRPHRCVEALVGSKGPTLVFDPI